MSQQMRLSGPLIRMMLPDKPLSVVALRTLLEQMAGAFDHGRSIGSVQFSQSGNEVSTLMDYIPFVWQGELNTHQAETMKWLEDNDYIQGWHVAKE